MIKYCWKLRQNDPPPHNRTIKNHESEEISYFSRGRSPPSLLKLQWYRQYKTLVNGYRDLLTCIAAKISDSSFLEEFIAMTRRCEGPAEGDGARQRLCAAEDKDRS